MNIFIYSLTPIKYQRANRIFPEQEEKSANWIELKPREQDWNQCTDYRNTHRATLSRIVADSLPRQLVAFQGKRKSFESYTPWCRTIITP